MALIFFISLSQLSYSTGELTSPWIEIPPYQKQVEEPNELEQELASSILSERLDDPAYDSSEGEGEDEDEDEDIPSPKTPASLEAAVRSFEEGKASELKSTFPHLSDNQLAQMILKLPGDISHRQKIRACKALQVAIFHLSGASPVLVRENYFTEKLH